jgi:hypothetical protein
MKISRDDTTFINESENLLTPVKLELEKMCRFFIQTFNKNPNQVIQLRILDSSVFVEQELSKLMFLIKDFTASVNFR